MIDDKLQSNKPNAPKRFWIVGAGRFGRIAMERICRQMPDATLSIVDRRPFSVSQRNIATICAEGIGWLTASLQPNAPVDMIIPAIPVHVAFEWIKSRLIDEYRIRPLVVPDKWLKQVPHAIRGDGGRVYASHADFICPDNCPEPKTICTHTGKERPMDLFRLLANIDIEDVVPIILRSHQLLPGVGGIYPDDLIHALKSVRNCQRPALMIATACRCHGVMDFVRLERVEVKRFS